MISNIINFNNYFYDELGTYLYYNNNYITRVQCDKFHRTPIQNQHIHCIRSYIPTH